MWSTWGSPHRPPSPIPRNPQLAFGLMPAQHVALRKCFPPPCATPAPCPLQPLQRFFRHLARPVNRKARNPPPPRRRRLLPRASFPHPSPDRPLLFRVLATACSLFAGILPASLAQTPAQPSAAVNSNDEVVELATFNVLAERDQGYQAANSITATKFATETKNVPVTLFARLGRPATGGVYEGADLGAERHHESRRHD